MTGSTGNLLPSVRAGLEMATDSQGDGGIRPVQMCQGPNMAYFPMHIGGWECSIDFDRELTELAHEYTLL